MCPQGRRLIAGEGGWLETATIVCHCLLIESDDGLVLVDTGFGLEDSRDLGRLGASFRLMGPRGDEDETGEDEGALGVVALDDRRPPRGRRRGDPFAPRAESVAAEDHRESSHRPILWPRNRGVVELWRG